MASKETLAKMWALLCNAFPDAPAPDETAKIYAKLLKHLPDDVLEAATLQAIKGHTFTGSIPAVGMILQQAEAINEARNPSMTSGEAWAEVLRLAFKCGADREPDMTDAMKKAVRGIGGWRYLCTKPKGLDHTDRANFRDIYKEAVKREKSERELLPDARKVLRLKA